MPETATINNVFLTIAHDYEELSQIAAKFVISQLMDKPASNLLVPTGTTPMKLYELLSFQSKRLFEQTTFFNFDEYVIKIEDSYEMLPAEDERSYHFFMKKYLFDNISATNSYFPDEKNITEEGYYDKLIEEKGGLDLCINAIGEDAHVFGFNFPGSSFTSKTRLVEMNPETKEVNAKLTSHAIPEFAITTGIQTGMSAKKILFLISGKRKAEVLKKVLETDPTEEIPATILKTHPNVTWLVDREAAALLSF